MAWEYHAIPYELHQDGIRIFIEESGDLESHVAELQILLGKEIDYTLQASGVINELLARYYPREQTGNQQVSARVGQEDFVNAVIKESKRLGASDIHLEPYENGCRLRVRIDGQLIERYAIPRDKYPAIVNKIKILARLDISEKRLPQDGRISFSEPGFKFDIRVSVLPTLYGEKIVLRILNNDAANLELTQLGFSTTDFNNYQEAIKKPNGIVLISGPTGSGKTTTLYATLKELNKTTRNILTIEDPVEYTLEGINQVQLKEDIGLGFASTLRTFLRQDPDIIMVGEIRDVDTAQMAIRAALTGHLVLSTIHTNSAWGIISRLIDMGIPSYMVANTLNLAVAQRLIRLLCPECKAKQPFEPDLLPADYIPSVQPEFHYQPVGCEHCYFTGYKGRKAIYEVLSINEELRDRIKHAEMSIESFIKTNKIRLLADQAYELIASGDTSIEEAYSFLFQN
ncbi:type II/IV secretion system protein [Marinilabiliaceae bacterium JC017]|nr:type II/IV secretion system protein [Marinilabiliaceae bacterium JC017]